MFCPNCGSLVEEGTKFCTNCGSTVDNTTPPAISYNAFSPKPQKISSLKGILFGGIALLLLVSAIIIIFKIAGNSNKGLRLGSAALIGTTAIGSEGGVITVESPGSVIDGMTLSVPAGAYTDKLDFTVSETEIKSHKFGPLFEPVTPLITIDNGHEFSDIPMTLTIPIQLAEDEFAMAFFYDADTKTLEGIPATELISSSITVMTSHFSDVVIAKVKKLMLQKAVMNNEADTDFMPGKDDFLAPNYGSSVFPGGHCGGQSIAMMHFFTMNSVKADTGIVLRTEKSVDNSSYDATPQFWQDDSLAYRLCSVLHKEYDSTWHSAFSSFIEGLNAHDDVTYYSFAYSIALSKRPQFVDLRGTDAKGGYHAHCMVVYGVTPDSLLICDPNFPGNLIRDVSVTKLDKPDPNGNTMKISDYNSGDNANSDEVVYDKLSYIGTYALVNYSKVDALWQQVMNGKDVGSGLFKADSAFITYKVDETTRKPVVVPLSTNFTISSAETGIINKAKPNCIYISVPKLTAGEIYTFYNGTTLINRYTGLGQDAKAWVIVPLTEGLNDIGIHVNMTSASGDLYVNFYRFSVTLTGDTVSSQSSSSEISIEPTAEASPTTAATPTVAATPTAAATPTKGQGDYDYSAALAAWMADFAAAANKTYDDDVSSGSYTLEWVNTPHIEGGNIIGAHVLWRHDVPKNGGEEKTWIEVYVFDADAPGVYLTLDELKAAYPQFQN